MQAAKETAANIGASAKAGMEKTKATVQEKVEKMKAHDPVEKDMATEKKQERINQAEINKQETREHNAATKHATSGPGAGGTTGATGGTYTHSTTGSTGYSTGPHQMSSVPGHGTGHVNEGAAAGTDSTAGHNPRVGSGTTGYGTTGTTGYGDRRNI